MKIIKIISKTKRSGIQFRKFANTINEKLKPNIAILINQITIGFN
jgi:hypothetical protein